MGTRQTKRCRDCHFLVWYQRRHGGDGMSVSSNPDDWWITSSWNADERAKGQPRGAGTLASACWRGIWDRRSNLGVKLEDQLDKDRGDTCFFFKWQDNGLHLKVASELQRRESENRHLKRGYRYTQMGLWIAATAIAVSALFQVLNFFFNSN